VLVWITHDREITDSAARGITQSHTLRSALQELGKGFETHKELGDAELTTKLVAAEVAILGTAPVGTEKTDAIRKVRQATINEIDTARTRRNDERAEQLQEFAWRERIGHWSTQSRHFLRDLYLLYVQRHRELEALGLDASMREHTAHELERAFIRAVERANDTMQQH
jgi:hypothetical protein